MNTVGTKLTVFAIVVSLLACFAAPVTAQPLSGDKSSRQRNVTWLYDSPLTVSEEITDLGDGFYRYSYSFENVDTKNIWHFGVYTDFEIFAAGTAWDTPPAWSSAIINDFSASGPPYIPDNLSPNIVALGLTWDPNGQEANHPIAPRDSVEGFTFVAQTSDSNPKFYFYETVEDGWAGDTGSVAAVGLTKSGQVAVTPDTWGKIKAMYR